MGTYVSQGLTIKGDGKFISKSGKGNAKGDMPQTVGIYAGGDLKIDKGVCVEAYAYDEENSMIAVGIYTRGNMLNEGIVKCEAKNSVGLNYGIYLGTTDCVLTNKGYIDTYAEGGMECDGYSGEEFTNVSGLMTAKGGTAKGMNMGGELMANSNGINVNKELNISGGEVNAYGGIGLNDHYGVWTTGNVTVAKGATLNLFGGKTNSESEVKESMYLGRQELEPSPVYFKVEGTVNADSIIRTKETTDEDKIISSIGDKGKVVVDGNEYLKNDVDNDKFIFRVDGNKVAAHRAGFNGFGKVGEMSITATGINYADVTLDGQAAFNTATGLNVAVEEPFVKFFKTEESGQTTGGEPVEAGIKDKGYYYAQLLVADGAPAAVSAFTVGSCYKITFNADGGVCDTEFLNTDIDGKIAKLPTATKEGFTFDGWYVGETKVTEDTVFEKDTEVKAVYTSKPAPSPTPSPTPEPKPLPFKDVAEGKWYYDAVDFVYQNGIMVGKSTEKFDPTADITRQEFVTILYNYMGKPEVSGEFNKFKDVPAGKWFAKPVQWGYENKVLNGKSNTEFGLGDVTRQEAAKFMYNFAVSQKITLEKKADLATFKDAGKIGKWAEDSVSYMAGYEVMRGKGNGKFDPTAKLTRGEAAQLIKNFIETFRKDS